jgi:hypothetical protein
LGDKTSRYSSIAIRHRRIPANFCVMAFLVVATLPSG